LNLLELHFHVESSYPYFLSLPDVLGTSKAESFIYCHRSLPERITPTAAAILYQPAIDRDNVVLVSANHPNPEFVSSKTDIKKLFGIALDLQQ
jgi:hypothetical protein